ncbi:MAG: DUF3365 domain-containing protein [Gammaproteobacteria bacterium]|nr:DUF3365 domain-containing protein [Gammaproteobacteria bacterium]MDH5629622.1 DUF3365 domain-containing protein [Gammaproteobacteria bacterium]
MKSLSYILSIAAISFIFALQVKATEQHADTQKLDAQAKKLIKKFGGQLKSTLTSEIKQNGLVAAIKVCKIKAPEISDSLSDKVTIGRTSLKYRNPDNKPDDISKITLMDFETQKQNNGNVSQIEKGQFIEKDGKKVYRFMKAIETGGLCLSCHGESLTKEVAEQIKTDYPDDKATGFKLGDIRGSFVVEIPVEQ